jgi:hypothetical protein
MRARTSSPRFVSWVDSVVIDRGIRSCRDRARAWKPATPIANSDGSPPTSVRLVSRVYR